MDVGTHSVAAMTEEERAYHACRNREHLIRVDDCGRTLLHSAAQAGKAAICRIYQNAGIDPTAKDSSGRTAADLARAAGYTSLARWLEASVANQAPNGSGGHRSQQSGLLDAREQRGLISGETEVLEQIVAAKRVNARNAKGDTPLHLTAAGGHLHLCSKLFEAGADATTRNNAGQTPADIAVDAGHDQLAVLLQEPDAEIRARVALGDGAIEQASPNIQSLPATVGSDIFDQIEFDGEEDPNLFHSRQGLPVVSATFKAIPSGAALKSGAAEDSDEWDLPGSLASVRLTDPISGGLSASQGSINKDVRDFAYPNGRASRQPQKLRNTNFCLSADTCRQWCKDVLAIGRVEEQAIQDLVEACQGNHNPADLTINVLRILEAAGVPALETSEICQFLLPSLEGAVDADELSEAVHAVCNRSTVVPGRQSFNVDRATEERLVREIANARHQLLNAVLDNSELLSEIVRHGQLVLAGEIAPDAFTDLELDLTDDNESTTEFSINLQMLQVALDAGIEVGGRARRKATEALDELEISPSYLKKLAGQTENGAGTSVIRLLSTCDRATEEFLLVHLPFARRETAKMVKSDEDPEELFQEAYFGMRRAVERFDPDRGVRFYIYALFWIRQQISRWRRNNGSTIRVPVHRYDLHAKIAPFVEEFQQVYMRAPLEVEVAQALGCDVKAIKSLALALSEPLEFSETMLATPDPSCSPEEIARRKQAEDLIKQELEDLDEREREIIRMRFGMDLDSEMTLEEIGQIYGVTRERIRQIEAKALQRLGRPGRARFLRGLL